MSNCYISPAIQAMIAEEQERRPPNCLDFREIDALVSKPGTQLFVLHGGHINPNMTEWEAAIAVTDEIRDARYNLGWGWRGHRGHLTLSEVDDALVVDRYEFRVVVRQKVTMNTGEGTMRITPTVGYEPHNSFWFHGKAGKILDQIKAAVLDSLNMSPVSSVEFETPVSVWSPEFITCDDSRVRAWMMTEEWRTMQGNLDQIFQQLTNPAG